MKHWGDQYMEYGKDYHYPLKWWQWFLVVPFVTGAILFIYLGVEIMCTSLWYFIMSIFAG